MEPRTRVESRTRRKETRAMRKFRSFCVKCIVKVCVSPCNYPTLVKAIRYSSSNSFRVDASSYSNDTTYELLLENDVIVLLPSELCSHRVA